MVTRTKKIFVGGLSAPSTIDDVKGYFEQFGRVSSFAQFRYPPALVCGGRKAECNSHRNGMLTMILLCVNQVEDAMLMFDKQTNRHRGELLPVFPHFCLLLFYHTCSELPFLFYWLIIDWAPSVAPSAGAGGGRSARNLMGSNRARFFLALFLQVFCEACACTVGEREWAGGRLGVCAGRGGVGGKRKTFACNR